MLDPRFLFLGCDTPVDWLIGLGSRKTGMIVQLFVSPLMSSIELYVSQDLLDHGCVLFSFHFLGWHQ